MGNHAIITFEEARTTHPVALYLHWNGGLESILAFTQYTYAIGTLYDYHTRLCQVIGNFFDEGLSLYAHPAADAEIIGKSCDNGHFHFACNRREGLQLLSHDGKTSQEYILTSSLKPKPTNIGRARKPSSMTLPLPNHMKTTRSIAQPKPQSPTPSIGTAKTPMSICAKMISTPCLPPSLRPKRKSHNNCRHH